MIAMTPSNRKFHSKIDDNDLNSKSSRDKDAAVYKSWDVQSALLESLVFFEMSFLSNILIRLPEWCRLCQGLCCFGHPETDKMNIEFWSECPVEHWKEI
jgi:hypothetical protein